MIEVLAAREAWCRPDESITWFWPLKGENGSPYVQYRVRGLKPDGGRKQFAKGALKAVGGSVGGLAADLALGTTDEPGYDKPRPSHTIVNGSGRDCLAVQRLAEWQPTNTTWKRGARDLAWVLTPQRLALLEFSERKATAKVAGAVRGLWGGGKVPTKPLPEGTSRAEIPRSEISGYEQAKYRFQQCDLTCLRFALIDGSSLDLRDHTGWEGVEQVERIMQGGEHS